MATYSATQFEKAVALIRDLPKDGPVKPSQDDQLLVSRPSPPFCSSGSIWSARDCPTLQRDTTAATSLAWGVSGR